MLDCCKVTLVYLGVYSFTHLFLDAVETRLGRNRIELDVLRVLSANADNSTATTDSATVKLSLLVIPRDVFVSYSNINSTSSEPRG